MLVLINAVKKNRVGNNKYKNIIPSRDKKVKISAKLNSQKFFKSKCRYLFKFKNFVKIQSTNTIEKSDFLFLNAKVVFTK